MSNENTELRRRISDHQRACGASVSRCKSERGDSTQKPGSLMPPIGTLSELGQRIKRAREKAGLKPKDAAQLYNVTSGTWSGMESGGHGDKMLDVVRLCQVLKTTPNELLGFERPPESDEMPAISFEDDVIHAVEVVLTEFGVANQDDAYEMGKAVVELAKRKTAPGVDRPSAVRTITFDWLQNFRGRLKRSGV
jgi:transcriptional regulator with XRE-family HTH domain